MKMILEYKITFENHWNYPKAVAPQEPVSRTNWATVQTNTTDHFHRLNSNNLYERIIILISPMQHGP